MKYLKDFQARMGRSRVRWRHRKYRMFPTPAEVEFIRIFGGHYITISFIKDPDTDNPLTIVTSLGPVLKRELIRHGIYVGRYFIDFAQVTPYRRLGIRIEERLDVVKRQQLDDYMHGLRWSLFHLQADDIFRDPMRVQHTMLRVWAEL